MGVLSLRSSLAAGSTLALAAVMVLAGMLSTASALASSHGKHGSKIKLSSRRGTFVPLEQTLDRPKYRAPTVTLPDGRVLIMGGATGSWVVEGASNTVEVFDPSTGAIEPSGRLATFRSRGKAALLADGRVMLAGGNLCCVSHAPMAEIYDPVLGESQPLPDLFPVRSYVSALAALPSGEVLVIGGSVGNPRSAATFDPTTGELTSLEDMPIGRGNAQTTVLGDGRVLIFGGTALGDRYAPQPWSVIFDPSDRSFSLGPKMIVPRVNFAWVAMSDGRVLVSGGNPDLHSETEVLKSAEIFDPSTERFETTGRPVIGRSNGSATRMSNGRVLVTGGKGWVRNGSKLSLRGTLIAEIFDPDTGRFIRTGNLRETRQSAVVLPLSNGRVILAGGFNDEEDRGKVYSKMTMEMFLPNKYNPKVKLLKVKPKVQTVRFKKIFRVLVHVRNVGKATAHDLWVCTYWGSEVFRTKKCPTIRKLKPGRSKWAVFKASISGYRDTHPARPVRPGKKRFDLFIKGHEVNLHKKVVVKVQRGKARRPADGATRSGGRA